MLLLGQLFQKKAYNKGRLNWEFEVGDKVVINQKNLGLLKEEKEEATNYWQGMKDPLKLYKK